MAQFMVSIVVLALVACGGATPPAVDPGDALAEKHVECAVKYDTKAEIDACRSALRVDAGAK